jgi:hydrogenase maturation protease
LTARDLPPGVIVEDFGTGGLDLAYEVMRGYDALILIDVTRGGNPPGTLYVLEPDEDEIAGGIADGEMIDPHGMDPQTVLRFVRAVSGWPGKVVVIACEPADIEEPGLGLSPEVEAAVGRAVDVALETVAGLRDEVERASAH